MNSLNDEDLNKIVYKLLQDKRFINSLSKSTAYFMKDDKIFDGIKKQVLSEAQSEVQKEVNAKVAEIKEYISCKIENWTHDFLLKDFDSKLSDAAGGIVKNSTKSEFSKMIAEQVVKNLELPRIVIDLSKNYAYVDYDEED